MRGSELPRCVASSLAVRRNGSASNSAAHLSVKKVSPWPGCAEACGYWRQSRCSRGWTGSVKGGEVPDVNSS
jgi:hypothetical protein